MRGRRGRVPPEGSPNSSTSLAEARRGVSGESLKRMRENEAGSHEPSAPTEEEQLRRVVAECEARLTEYAVLAAHVRHEINNPLTGLIGQAQLLLREELSDTARRRVQTIEQLANRIRDTVASLREIQTPPPSMHVGAAAPDATNEPPRH
jgi:signal transduction histidine kinase